MKNAPSVISRWNETQARAMCFRRGKNSFEFVHRPSVAIFANFARRARSYGFMSSNSGFICVNGRMTTARNCGTFAIGREQCSQM